MVIEFKGVHFGHKFEEKWFFYCIVKEMWQSDPKEPLLVVKFVQGLNDALSCIQFRERPRRK